MDARTAKITSRILTRVFYSQFGYCMHCAYRLEWHDLRLLSCQQQLTQEYLDEINEELRTWNLKLTTHLDFLVVDKIDPTKGLRRFPSGHQRFTGDSDKHIMSYSYLGWRQRFM